MRIDVLYLGLVSPRVGSGDGDGVGDGVGGGGGGWGWGGMNLPANGWAQIKGRCDQGLPPHHLYMSSKFLC